MKTSFGKKIYLTIIIFSVRATFKEFYNCYHNFLIFYHKEIMDIFGWIVMDNIKNEKKRKIYSCKFCDYNTYKH